MAARRGTTGSSAVKEQLHQTSSSAHRVTLGQEWAPDPLDAGAAAPITGSLPGHGVSKAQGKAFAKPKSKGAAAGGGSAAVASGRAPSPLVPRLSALGSSHTLDGAALADAAAVSQRASPPPHRVRTTGPGQAYKSPGSPGAAALAGANAAAVAEAAAEAQVDAADAQDSVYGFPMPETGPGLMPPPVHIASNTAMGGNPAPGFAKARLGRGKAPRSGSPGMPAPMHRQDSALSTTSLSGGASLMGTMGSAATLPINGSLRGGSSLRSDSAGVPPQVAYSDGGTASDAGSSQLGPFSSVTTVTNAARKPLNSVASEAVGQGPGGFRLAPPDKVPPKQAHVQAQAARKARLIQRLEESVHVVEAEENAEALEAEEYKAQVAVDVFPGVTSKHSSTSSGGGDDATTVAAASTELPAGIGGGDDGSGDEHDSVNGDLVRDRAGSLSGSFLTPEDAALLQRAVSAAADRMGTHGGEHKTGAAAGALGADGVVPSPRFSTAANALNMQAVLREAKSKERARQKAVRQQRRAARREARRRHRERLEESKRALRERRLMAKEDLLAGGEYGHTGGHMCLRDLMASAQRGMGLPNWEPEDDPEGEWLWHMDYASVERNLWLCMVTEEDLAVALHEVLEAPDTKAGDKLRCRVVVGATCDGFHPISGGSNNTSPRAQSTRASGGGKGRPAVGSNHMKRGAYHPDVTLRTREIFNHDPGFSEAQGHHYSLHHTAPGRQHASDVHRLVEEDADGKEAGDKAAAAGNGSGGRSSKASSRSPSEGGSRSKPPSPAPSPIDVAPKPAEAEPPSQAQAQQSPTPAHPPSPLTMSTPSVTVAQSLASAVGAQATAGVAQATPEPASDGKDVAVGAVNPPGGTGGEEKEGGTEAAEPAVAAEPTPGTPVRASPTAADDGKQQETKQQREQPGQPGQPHGGGGKDEAVAPAPHGSPAPPRPSPSAAATSPAAALVPPGELSVASPRTNNVPFPLVTPSPRDTYEARARAARAQRAAAEQGGGASPSRRKTSPLARSRRGGPTPGEALAEAVRARSAANVRAVVELGPNLDSSRHHHVVQMTPAPDIRLEAAPGPRAAGFGVQGTPSAPPAAHRPYTSMGTGRRGGRSPKRLHLGASPPSHTGGGGDGPGRKARVRSAGPRRRGTGPQGQQDRSDRDGGAAVMSGGRRGTTPRGQVARGRPAEPRTAPSIPFTKRPVTATKAAKAVAGTPADASRASMTTPTRARSPAPSPPRAYVALQRSAQPQRYRDDAAEAAAARRMLVQGSDAGGGGASGEEVPPLGLARPAVVGVDTEPVVYSHRSLRATLSPKRGTPRAEDEAVSVLKSLMLRVTEESLASMGDPSAFSRSAGGASSSGGGGGRGGDESDAHASAFASVGPGQGSAFEPSATAGTDGGAVATTVARDPHGALHNVDMNVLRELGVTRAQLIAAMNPATTTASSAAHKGRGASPIVPGAGDAELLAALSSLTGFGGSIANSAGLEGGAPSLLAVLGKGARPARGRHGGAMTQHQANMVAMLSQAVGSQVVGDGSGGLVPAPAPGAATGGFPKRSTRLPAVQRSAFFKLGGSDDDGDGGHSRGSRGKGGDPGSRQGREKKGSRQGGSRAGQGDGKEGSRVGMGDLDGGGGGGGGGGHAAPMVRRGLVGDTDKPWFNQGSEAAGGPTTPTRASPKRRVSPKARRLKGQGSQRGKPGSRTDTTTAAVPIHIPSPKGPGHGGPEMGVDDRTADAGAHSDAGSWRGATPGVVSVVPPDTDRSGEARAHMQPDREPGAGPPQLQQELEPGSAGAAEQQPRDVTVDVDDDERGDGEGAVDLDATGMLVHRVSTTLDRVPLPPQLLDPHTGMPWAATPSRRRSSTAATRRSSAATNRRTSGPQWRTPTARSRGQVTPQGSWQDDGGRQFDAQLSGGPPPSAISMGDMANQSMFLPDDGGQQASAQPPAPVNNWEWRDPRFAALPSPPEPHRARQHQATVSSRRVAEVVRKLEADIGGGSGGARVAPPGARGGVFPAVRGSRRPGGRLARGLTTSTRTRHAATGYNAGDGAADARLVIAREVRKARATGTRPGRDLVATAGLSPRSALSASRKRLKLLGISRPGAKPRKAVR